MVDAMTLDDFGNLISTTISAEALEEADLSKLEAALTAEMRKRYPRLCEKFY